MLGNGLNSRIRWAHLGAAAVIVCTTAGILIGYRRYFPAEFQNGFLSDKASYFYTSPYGLAFYCHILAAPAAILVGLLQFWPFIRKRHPRWHRRVGQVYSLLVLLFVTPGGFVMAIGTNWGFSVQACFAILSSLTWFVTWRAWMLAHNRKFHDHARWATRSYTLMCSAIVLRITDIPLRQLGVEATISYNLCVWLSWLAPLAAIEIWLVKSKGAMK